MDLLKDKVKPLYLKMLSATAGGVFIACVFGIVDAVMVGRYHGPNGTAALAIFNPIWAFVYSIGLLIGIGGSVLFSNYRGSGEEKKSNEYFALSIIIGFIFSALALLVLVLFNKQLFVLFGANQTLLALVEDYFYCIKFAIPCCIFNNLIGTFLRNDGNPSLATVATVVGGLFNIIGDYIFIFVCNMGVFGAGLATAIGLYLSLFIMLFHFFLKRNTLRLVKPTLIFNKTLKILINGFPTAINDLSMGIIGVLFNRQIMTYLNADALAVYGIITQVTAFVQCCGYGAGQASQPIMSQALGANEPKRIKDCLRYGIITSIIIGVAWASLTFIMPNGFVKMFMTPTPSVLAVAPTIIRFYGISYLITPVNIYLTFYFQSIMKSKTSIISSLVRGLFLSGLLIIILPLIFGANSIWFTMLVTEIIVAIYSIIFAKKYTRAL